MTVAKKPRQSARIACDPAEWEMRIQLAACYLMIDHLGWTELIWSHVTARVPGREDHFLINPYGLRYDEITASSLVKVDHQGEVVGTSEWPINPAGFVIHSAIHMARPDVQCVLHTHTPAGMAASTLACGIKPIHMYAVGYDGLIAYHDYEGPSLDNDERQRLGRSLGDSNLLVLRNHGLITCGRTIAEALVHMYRLERACQIQLMAQATGERLAEVPEAVRRESVQRNHRFLSFAGKGTYGELEFAALQRLMDHKDPDYRN